MQMEEAVKKRHTIAERAAVKDKRIACHDKAGTVKIEGVDLRPAHNPKYLGYKSTADGDTRKATVDKMQADDAFNSEILPWDIFGKARRLVKL